MSALLEAAIAAGTPGAPAAMAETARADVLGALQALATLALLGSVAWLVWRLRQRALAGHETSGRLRVEERVRLDLRSALVIVRVDERRFLLATSAQGPAHLITELTPERAQPTVERP